MVAMFFAAGNVQAEEYIETANIAVAWRNPDTGRIATVSITHAQMNRVERLCKAGMDSDEALESVIAATRLRTAVAKK
jgi:hypothetical protein